MEKKEQKEYFAICNVCKSEMRPNCGCDIAKFRLGDRRYERIRTGYKDDIIPGTTICRDCNAGAGQYHHLGCAQERCPNCLQQFFLCHCLPDAYIAADYEDISV